MGKTWLDRTLAQVRFQKGCWPVNPRSGRAATRTREREQQQGAIFELESDIGWFQAHTGPEPKTETFPLEIDTHTQLNLKSTSYFNWPF